MTYMGWWFAGAFGFVCGHLLAMTETDADGYWWRCVAVPVPVVAGVVGFWLTWRMP